MAKTINILPAVLINESNITVDVEITEGGYTRTDQYAFSANDFDCNCSSSNPYVARFMFEPGDPTMILDVQGDFTTCKFDGVTKASAYAMAQDVIADIGQYATAGGGGGGSITANHGNTVYVSVDGNDSTGQVGNVSKPYKTLAAAVAALEPGLSGTAIVLTVGANDNALSGYDYNSQPTELHIVNHSTTPVHLTGTCSFDYCVIDSPVGVVIATSVFCVANTKLIINADYVTYTEDCTGTCGSNTTINCNTLWIQTPLTSCSYADFKYLNWKNSLTVEVDEITYLQCNPMVWKGSISQTGADEPTATVYDNNTGETLAFQYVDIGEYYIVSPGSKFTPKTFWNHPSLSAIMTPGTSASLRRISDSELRLLSRDSFGDQADEILVNLPLLIEIYP